MYEFTWSTKETPQTGATHHWIEIGPTFIHTVQFDCGHGLVRVALGDGTMLTKATRQARIAALIGDRLAERAAIDAGLFALRMLTGEI